MGISRFALIAAAIGFAFPVFADVQFSLDSFEKASSGQASVVTVGGKAFGKLGLSPDAAIGPVSFGLDLNLYMPLSGGSVPSEFNSVVLRRIGYTHYDVAGIEYGRLKNVTFGQGLLMANYDSGAGGATEQFSNDKAGTKGFVRMNGVAVNAMYTASQVQAARVTYDLPFFAIAGVPLVAGATYVADDNGLDNVVQGNVVKRAAQKGYAFDLSYPLFGEFMTVYTEYAKLENRGSGMTGGIRGDLMGALGYKAEVRHLGVSFVPEYFGRSYEATSFDFATDSLNKAVTGFLVGAYSEFADGYFKAGAEYELYENKNLLSAAVGWQRVMDTVGVINYRVPFQTGGQPILSADILYYTNGPVDYVVNWKQVSIDANTKTESYAVALRFNFQKMLPGIPFF